MIRVLNPVGLVHLPTPIEGRGLASLDSIRIGFSDNSKFNGRVLLESVEAELVKAYGVRRTAWAVKNATGPLSEDAEAELAKECDAVVTAIGD